MLFVEQFCLRVVSELDQLETDWNGCMESKDPEAVAAAYRLFGHHLQMTMKHLGMAAVVSESELSTVPNGATTGVSESGHACPLLAKTVPAGAGSVDQD